MVQVPNAIRDEVVRILVMYLRLLTVPLLAQRYYAHTVDPTRSARKAVKVWETAGLVETDTAVLPLLGHPTGPLYDSATDPEPNYDQVSHYVRTRAAGTPRQTTVLWASAATRDTYGVSGKNPRPKEYGHDAALAAVYYHLADINPQWRWTSEDRVGSPRHERADAMIDTGTETIAIEWAGMYSAQQLRDQVNRAQTANQRVQIW